MEQNFQRTPLPLQSLYLGLHLFLGKDDIHQLVAKLVKFGDMSRRDGGGGQQVFNTIPTRVGIGFEVLGLTQTLQGHVFKLL